VKAFPHINADIHFITEKNGIQLSVLREDKIHPLISGNKFRKLKYNLKAFEEGKYEGILTFGGAYSNHIAATAAAGREFGFRCIGVIRGEELAEKIIENPTLHFAASCGMELHFIPRTQYRNKNQSGFLKKIKSEFGNIFILPEGGTNEAAVRGCEEILNEKTSEFDYICCAAGTGGTVSGLIRSAEKHQKILIFPALKDSDFLIDVIKNYSTRSNYELIQKYHFGGYAKITDELIGFINSFKKETNVPLEPIYTGKMLLGIFDMMELKLFPKGSKVLAVHTGGLQGIQGFNQKLKIQGKTLIK